MKSILKYAGAKWRIADWIIDHMPPHEIYCEPFFGSGGVFFNKIPLPKECINDINGDVVYFFRVVRDQPDELARLIALTPWAREEYYDAHARYTTADTDLERARLFCVAYWQSYGIKIRSRSGFKMSVCPTSPQLTKTWNNLPDVIVAAAARLKNAAIDHDDAMNVIRKYNNPQTLLYIDPPYVAGTRREKIIYTHEMSDDDHVRLLEQLMASDSIVMISGYDNEIYNDILTDWARFEINTQCITNESRREVLWINRLENNLINIAEGKL